MSKNSLKKLLVKLQSSYWPIRPKAARVPGNLGNACVFEPLIQALQHGEDWEVRSAAARAPGKSGDVRAVGLLIQALQHNEGDRVLWHAACSLVHSALGNGRIDSVLQASAPNARAILHAIKKAVPNGEGDRRFILHLIEVFRRYPLVRKDPSLAQKVTKLVNKSHQPYEQEIS